MDCKNIERIIYRYIYKETSDERELVAVKAHLDKCKECREHLLEIRETLPEVIRKAA